MTTALISIIVPAYNIAPWIGQCLESICCQTYSHLEILAIDDGSTDETGTIIDSYAARDARIVPVHQANAGLVAVREKGISLATGQYIGFVDGDDTIEPEMFERLLTNALKYDADISHCGVTFVWPDGRKEPHYGTGILLVHDNLEGQRALLDGTQIEPSLCSKLYRAELLRNSCLDPTVLNNEDLLRNFVLFQRAQKSVFEDFCGYRYLQRAGSMSKDRSRQVRAARHIFRARQLIVQYADERIYPFAMRCWLSCVVNTVSINSSAAGDELAVYRAKCRAFLREHRRDLHYLIPRQRLAAWLIIVSPVLHKAVYRIYQKRR